MSQFSASKYFRYRLMIEEFSKVGLNLLSFMQLEAEDSGETFCNCAVAVRLIDSITVRQADNALLSSKSFEDSWSWSGGPGHRHYCLATAVWRSGAEKLDFLARFTGGSSGAESEVDAPTLSDQLVGALEANPGLGQPDFIVLRVKEDHDDWGRGEVHRDIVIYKFGKLDLADYFARMIDEAAAGLKAEIARIAS